MKTLFIILTLSTLGLKVKAADPSDVSEKVVSAFQASFKTASEIKWEKLGNNFEVRFKQNNNTYHILYNRKGKLVKSIAYYGVENLPVFIRAQVANEYKDKNIFGVTEEFTGAQTVYHIVLEDSKTWSFVDLNTDGNQITSTEFNKSIK